MALYKSVYYYYYIYIYAHGIRHMYIVSQCGSDYCLISRAVLKCKMRTGNGLFAEFLDETTQTRYI